MKETLVTGSKSLSSLTMVLMETCQIGGEISVPKCDEQLCTMFNNRVEVYGSKVDKSGDDIIAYRWWFPNQIITTRVRMLKCKT